MSRYASHAEADRKRKLSLSQFLPSKFLTYLLYNSYVVYRCIATEEVMRNSLTAPNLSACLSNANVKWKEVTFREFVAQLNKKIRRAGTYLLLPRIFQTEEQVTQTAIQFENVLETSPVNLQGQGQISHQTPVTLPGVQLPKLPRGRANRISASNKDP